MDPDPDADPDSDAVPDAAIIIIDLQEANKNLKVFLHITF
jgi:hypothetical protein